MLSPFRPRARDTRRDSKPDSDAEPAAASMGLRVLVVDRAPFHRVRYVDQLLGDNSGGEHPGGIEFEFRGNALGAYGVDVVHLTTSRAVIGDRGLPEREQIRRVRRFTKRLQRRRIALVRSLRSDDVDEHRTMSRAEALLDRATSTFIAENNTIAGVSEHGATVIRHSHLRDRFLGYPKRDVVPGRLLFMAPDVFPKSYEGPLKVYAIADLPGSTLRVVGRAPRELADSFARTHARNPLTISLRDEALSDAARVEEVTLSEMVIVASPDSYETLGVILLALSLDRPVLVEETPTTTQLADEVGRAWLRLHKGPLTAAILEEAVEGLRNDPPSGHPDLGAREPNAIADEYAAAFRVAAASRRPQR